MASLQRKIVKGKEYWAIVESKRVNGKPRPIVIDYIGNRNKLMERLQNNSISGCTLKSFSHGDTYALFKLARKIGIEDILAQVFPSQTVDGLHRSTSLLLAAIHRACMPGSKNSFGDWFGTTTLPSQLNIRPDKMTSQHFWQQMDGITAQELMLAEDAISKVILEKYEIGLQKLALDYTNYFTYIATENKRNTLLSQRGHNKQKRYDLRQCSLALVTSKDTGIPLFSHVYEGNRNDQIEFKEYLPILEQRIPGYNPEEITLIFDGGSNSKENLAKLQCHYICRFSLSNCKELYEVDICKYDTIIMKDEKMKCYRLTKNIWGKERVAILTFSQRLYDGQARELAENITKTLKELSEFKEKIQNPKSRISKTPEGLLKQLKKILKRKYIAEIIKVQVSEEEIFYEKDDLQKEEIMSKYFGKKLLISDHDDWETEEIIKAYHEQDSIEKIFRDTKDAEHFSMRPIYHWTDQKIRVHIFICLLGLTLTTVLRKELQMRGMNISKDKLMENLSLIRQSWVKESESNKVIKVIEEMDETQSRIWEIIGGS